MSASDILSFLELIYEDETGVACACLKDASGFKRSFFEWPERKTKMAEYIELVASTGEVYYAPALFHSASSVKQNVKGSRVVWVDYDGNAIDPAKLENIPPPSIRVGSSLPGHEHWYWKLSNTASMEELDKINRALTYALDADISGWDANQVLRTPATYNHKREASTKLIESNSKIYTVDTFSWIPIPPVAEKINIDPKLVLPMSKLMFKYAFPQYVVDLFTKGTSNRSDGLMQLAFELTERQVPNEDVLSLLIHADKRWGKFAERDDQWTRLIDIISVAREKYPMMTSDAPFDANSKSMGFMSIIDSSIEIEWVIEGLLETKGNCMLTGAPGAGKTQFSLQIAEHLALGKNLLHFEIPQARKVGFLSLEMDLPSLKSFLKKNAIAYTEQEKLLLEQNFRIWPLGQPLYLNLPNQQDQMKARIREEGIEVICIDSLSRAMNGSLTDEVAIRGLMAWIDSIRQSTGVAVWWIHHNRKASGENRKPKNLEDIFGSVFITASITSAATLWPNNNKNNQVELSFLKTRLQEKDKPLNMIRNRETVLFSLQNDPSNPDFTVELMEDEEMPAVFKGGRLAGI